jgi:hypothetical protein
MVANAIDAAAPRAPQTSPRSIPSGCDRDSRIPCFDIKNAVHLISLPQTAREGQGHYGYGILLGVSHQPPGLLVG